MMSVLPHIFRELGYVLLENTGGGFGVLLSEPPPWFTEIWGTSTAGDPQIPLAARSPFLADLLQGQEPPESRSETWLEKTAEGNEIALQATTLRTGDKQYIVIRNLGSDYYERLRFLQSARDAALTHEALLREIQKKEILLHCIVHDLSQPLSAIRAAFDCLSAEKISKRSQEFATIGKLASQEQESMIVAILQTFSADLRSALAGTKDTNTSPDLRLSAAAAMTMLRPAFEVKRVRLVLDPKIDQHEVWRVRGEETRLRRLFLNLLENALRYSPAEGTVTVGLERQEGTCTAFVDDEGPGLPEDLNPTEVFSLLSQGKQGGGKVGLGLYFCKVTVERWGGTVGCTSLSKRGSRFWFRLPQVIDAPPANLLERNDLAVQKSKPQYIARKSKLNVLFADDQQQIRTLIVHQLRSRGHKVTAMASGEAALKRLRQRQFDIALLDEEMPGMSGVQVVQAMRNWTPGSPRPSLLVALTANSTPQDRERLRASGFDEVIGKPFHLQTFDALMTRSMGTAAAPEPPRDMEAADASPLEALSQRVNGDKKLMGKLIDRFLGDLPLRMKSLRRSLHRGDADELATQAHALKGLIGIFGVPNACARLQQLQDFGRHGKLKQAFGVYELLSQDMAKLEAALTEQTQPRKRARNAGAAKGWTRRRPSR